MKTCFFFVSYESLWNLKFCRMVLYIMGWRKDTAQYIGFTVEVKVGVGA
jgi:hypothetical protein